MRCSLVRVQSPSHLSRVWRVIPAAVAAAAAIAETMTAPQIAAD